MDGGGGTKEVTEQQKLFASDRAANDQFGSNVDVDGQVAAVGAKEDTHGGEQQAGSAYLVERSGGEWRETQKVTASDAAARDDFGRSVSIDGGWLFVGAGYDDHGGMSDAGSAYVFRRSGGTWSETQKLTASNATADALFGRAVAVDGEWAVVGASKEPHDGSDGEGAAYVFRRSGGNWSEHQRLVASDASERDLYGQALAIDGETIVVGAYKDWYDGGNEAGTTYVYELRDGSWEETQILNASDASGTAQFGASVALDGEWLAIGAQLDTYGGTVRPGSVFVFRRGSDGWIEQQKVVAPNPEKDGRFGSSVALDGETLVIGAYKEDYAGEENSGVTYVYRGSGGAWTEQRRLTTSDAVPGDWLGSVGVGDGWAVVGASRDDGGGNDEAGSVAFYRLPEEWAGGSECPCPGNESCYRGRCYPECQADGDCGSGERCLDKTCRASDCSDVTCDESESCYRGTCYPECQADGDCGNGKRCVDQTCRATDCSDVTCARNESCFRARCYPECRADGDCGSGKLCEQHACVPESEVSRPPQVSGCGCPR